MANPDLENELYLEIWSTINEEKFGLLTQVEIDSVTKRVHDQAADNVFEADND